MNHSQQSILNLARQRGILRSRDLAAFELPRVGLGQLVQAGELTRIRRGSYVLAERDFTENSTFAEVAVQYPKAVFCLMSALLIHGLTTQSPHQVWIAIPNKARTPNMKYPPLKVVRFSEDTLHHGIEFKVIDGVIQIPVTTVEKTIADCFKYRNKIGLDVAIEALQEAWRSRRVTMDQLWKSAQLCRVSNVMRPYLESLQ